jgi:diguanylate cyclase (GGDEF)-like protein
MKSLTPDFLTAFGMTAMSAFTVSWVLWALGRQYWHQGMSWAIGSTFLYGCAYISFSLQNILGWIELQVFSKILISAAMATFTIALHHYRQVDNKARDALILILPIALSLGLAAFYLPANIAKFNVLQSLITVVQTLYTISVLLMMRNRTPGTGWVVVTSAAFIQLAAILPLIFAKARPSPNFVSQASTSDIVSMWLVCLMLFMKLVITCFGFLIMLRDRQSALEQDKAKLDYLTQLPNRATLVETLVFSTQQATEQQQPLSLLVIDIDHFKNFNDTYGHLAGDQVIQQVAQILAQQCRSTDLAARYGGEEFVVVLPNTPLQGAEMLANRLCEIVRAHVVRLKNGENLHVTISVGVYSGIPTLQNHWENLIDYADTAMYTAKQRGRNQAVVYLPSMTA